MVNTNHCRLHSHRAALEPTWRPPAPPLACPSVTLLYWPLDCLLEWHALQLPLSLLGCNIEHGAGQRGAAAPVVGFLKAKAVSFFFRTTTKKLYIRAENLLTYLS